MDARKADIDLQPWLSEAVLIYGPRKGGTTLFQNLLDGGGELFVYPAELKLKKMLGKPRMTEKEYQALVMLPRDGAPLAADAGTSQWTDDDYAKHNRSNAIGGHLFDRAGYDACWDMTSDERRDVAGLVAKDVFSVHANCSLRSMLPRKWLAKEVGGRTHKIVNLWRRLFPDGRVLFITRSPLMTVRAILNDRRRKGVRMPAIDVLKQIFDSVVVNAAVRRYRDQSWAITIRHEDLVHAPESVIRQVCGFLGIEFDPVLTEPTLFGEKVVVSTSSKPSQSIFEDRVAWYDGLKLREKALVLCAYPVAVGWAWIATAVKAGRL